MESKDKLLSYFLSGHIKLSEYDYRFMANLYSMTEKNNTITSNQNDLFSRLISKYSRQLAKSNLTQEKLAGLEWTFPVIPSSTEYTSAYLYLENDMLNLRSPFNKNFIAHFNKVDNNSFRWNKERKVYTSEFSTLALKNAYDSMHKFYKSVRYCKVLADIIAELEKNDGLLFNPTLKLINDRVYLLAANEFVCAAAEKIGFNIDINTIYKLSQLGIDMDSSITDNRKELEFASQYYYSHDMTELETLAEYLDNIDNCKIVLGRGIRYQEKQQIEYLTKHIKNVHTQMINLMQDAKPEDNFVMLQLGAKPSSYMHSRINKIVTLTDSRPVKIK